ncbi:MAG TPA: glycine oxidase ThiO [Pyrinomonadaceae bacterium]|nr:glycine oxidase ThiO [Pyrinomonadaceae bacterium]
MKTSDVLIIGAGVIGLSIARELHKRGVGKICIVEKGAVGRESSWAAAGILAPQIEADIDDDFFRLCFESNRIYRQFADELRDETNIDIELDQSGTLYLGFHDKDSAEIRERYEWQRAAGLEIEHLTADETLRLEPNLSPNVRESLYFPREGQVENRKLVEALVRYAELNGINIIDNSEVGRVLIKDGIVTGAETRNETYAADVVVVASGAWTSTIKFGEINLPIQVKPIRGQMICYRPPTPICHHVVYSHRGYLVPRADGRLLAGATAEDTGFDKSTTETGIHNLQTAAIEIAPKLETIEIVDKWAGLRPYAAGGRPVIGRVPGVNGLFIATGHFRNGILLAPITARLIADAIAGNEQDIFLKSFGLNRVEIIGK